MEHPGIAVIGGGSWATAIVKILTENSDYVGWWMRDPEVVKHVKMFHTYPRFLQGTELLTENIDISSDLNHIVEQSKYLIFATPSVHLKKALETLTVPLTGKVIFSAIKGIVSDENLIVGADAPTK